MIYIVGNSTQVKIGFSSTFQNRLAAIKTHSPIGIEVYLLIEGNIKKEKELHRKFRKFKLIGEWFSLSDEIKTFINENKINSLYIDRRTTAEGLKKLRQEQKFSLREVGERLGISAQSVKETEDRYENSTLTLNGLKKYLDAIGYKFSISFIESL